MNFFEKYFPETKRFRIFISLYFSLFLTLICTLFFRQVIENDLYLEKERKQGQRRIVKPGARGDVLDRGGNLLIGNRAHYSANLHLELLNKDIWEHKLRLRRITQTLKEEINQLQDLSLENLLNLCFQDAHIQRSKIKVYGKLRNESSKVIFLIDNVRQNLVQRGVNWTVEIDYPGNKTIQNILIQNVDTQIFVSVAGLFSIEYALNGEGEPIYPSKEEDTNNNSFFSFFNNEESNPINFSTNGYSLSWEARYAAVHKYLDLVNQITGRNNSISLEELQRHWRRKLVLPFEICGDLTNEEYALLIEKLPPDSPIQVQAKAVRHYPHNYLASHVLGYVGSGYEASPESLSGSDLATFELQGRTGKAGIEKTFDDQLRGKDGVDIWVVNPMGSRFERVEREPSAKGKSVRLTLDMDLQKIAEDSISRTVDKVGSQRLLPDKDWGKTLERRTNRALIGTNETEVRAELLLNSFKDAPFPLTGKQASTVAGFRGTEADANRLLRHLYAQGVLQRSPQNAGAYFLSPPPPPPGAAVLIDLKSSEILALASKPNYDLSSLTPFISQAAYDEIQRREAWLPRAWHPGYAPASPFKLVTALAGLHKKTLHPEEELMCEGIYRGMKCHVHPGHHGPLNLRNAIAQSCNVYFFRSAEKMGHDHLIAEAKDLEMDQKPPLALPTLRDTPILPDPTWKKNNLGVKWTMEDTFNISIGQGGLRQSPLQMACFISKLATNSKFFTPKLHFDELQKADNLEKLTSTQNRQAIVDGMILATQEGTARRCQIEGMTVAGKTGTGQWRNHNMKLNLAWFVGFAPADDPKVAVSVLIEGVIPQDQVQGGLTATPIARDLFAAYFAKYPHVPSQNQETQN
jgi:cell division protein FtsI/penicillin-binding protein 2